MNVEHIVSAKETKFTTSTNPVIKLIGDVAIVWVERDQDSETVVAPVGSYVLGLVGASAT